MEVFSFLFGSVIGSFLNVLILRLPKHESLLTRSACPSCHHVIAWYYNIPIVSYFLLKGRCAYCQNNISFVYPLVELLTGCITLLAFMQLGLTWDLLYVLLFLYTLIVLSFIDFAYKAVPDYLLLLALVLSFFVTQNSLLDAFSHAFIISGAFVLLNFIISFYIQNIKSRLVKDESLKTQEALGEGDIPVLASMAAILGIKGAFVAIFLASVFAIIPSIYFTIRKKDIQTPFIPYLVLGFCVEYFLRISKVFM